MIIVSALHCLEVTSSPFLLTFTFNKNLKTYNNEDPKFFEQFLRSLHVGDLNALSVKENRG